MLDVAMEQRLESIRRSHQALTERLGDPDVIADASLLMKVMSDRSKSEDVVHAYEEVSMNTNDCQRSHYYMIT
jgi:protein subunit release factor A